LTCACLTPISALISLGSLSWKINIGYPLTLPWCQLALCTVVIGVVDGFVYIGTIVTILPSRTCANVLLCLDGLLFVLFVYEYFKTLRLEQYRVRGPFLALLYPNLESSKIKALIRNLFRARTPFWIAFFGALTGGLAVQLLNVIAVYGADLKNLQTRSSVGYLSIYCLVESCWCRLGCGLFLQVRSKFPPS